MVDMISGLIVAALVNMQRVQANEVMLRADPFLDKIAEQRCVSMAEWSHKGWMASAMLEKYRTVGENLARDFNSPNDVVRAWMASPTHRKNILESRYRAEGITVCSNAIGSDVIVQVFGGDQ